MSTRIGLTGAQGVLGQRLAHRLRQRAFHVQELTFDIRERDRLLSWVMDVDEIVHAAAIVPVDLVLQRPGEAASVNVAGTAGLAECCARASRPLVYLSTSHVYAHAPRPLREDDEAAPCSIYGLSKLQGEEWVRHLCPEHLIIRIFSFFDPLQAPPFLVPTLARRIGEARPGETLPLVGGEAVRDMADADWVARVCSELIATESRGTLNCGTGNGRSVLEIAQTLSSVLGRADLIWQANGGTGDMLVADVARLRKTLGGLPPADLATQLSSLAPGRVPKAR